MTLTVELPAIIEHQIQEIAEGKGITLTDAFALFMRELALRFDIEASKRGVPAEQLWSEAFDGLLDAVLEAPASTVSRELQDRVIREDPTARLMYQWIKEDGTDDAAELTRREVEWKKLQANLEEHRLSLPTPKI